MIIKQSYINGIQREYKVDSAIYGDESNVSAVLYTEKDGAVVISAADNPEMWNQLIASGMQIQAFVKPSSES